MTGKVLATILSQVPVVHMAPVLPRTSDSLHGGTITFSVKVTTAWQNSFSCLAITRLCKGTATFCADEGLHKRIGTHHNPSS